MIKNIKHSLCEVSLDYDRSMKEFDRLSEEEKNFQLPDGNYLAIDANIKFSAYEGFFQ